MSKLRIAGTVENSITDGNGLRFVIFAQGCMHKCEGCHNPHTHPLDGGKIVDTEDLYKQIFADQLLQGVTFSGGEPFLQPEPLAELAEKIKANTDLDITIFSGYTFEALCAMTNNSIQKLLHLSDYLVDGRFEVSQLDLTLYMKGSSNQRFIDLKQTFIKNKICIYSPIIY